MLSLLVKLVVALALALTVSGQTIIYIDYTSGFSTVLPSPVVSAVLEHSYSTATPGSYLFAVDWNNDLTDQYTILYPAGLNVTSNSTFCGASSPVEVVFTTTSVHTCFYFVSWTTAFNGLLTVTYNGGPNTGSIRSDAISVYFNATCPSAAPTGPTPAALNQAQSRWEADTSVVSAFLESAPYLTGTDLTTLALKAYNAEVDELTWKGVLDTQFLNVASPDPNIVAANNVLVNQGTFQLVVNNLLTLANTGASLSAAQVLALINQTNVDRCTFVLPAIDAYFNATGTYLGDYVPLHAIRPSNCPVPALTTNLNVAVTLWQADTAVVSAFLQSAQFLTGTALTSAALNAFNAEVDELTHKAVIDAQFLNVPQPNGTIVAASNVLVNLGTFQFVVNALQTLAVNGSTMTNAQVVALVQATNLDRCLQVLPAIDAYFQVVASFLGNPRVQRAFRPSNCPPFATAPTLEQAVFLWQADTSIVSAFLESAPYLSGTALTTRALLAYNAEVDELTHKAVIDQQFLNIPDPNTTLVAANNVLVTQGTFQLVVNNLLTLSQTGASLSQAQVLAIINQTNVDRCTFVLPAIDAYFLVADQALGDSVIQRAVRPSNCNISLTAQAAANTLQIASSLWQADTGIVSGFLQSAEFLTGTALTSLALAAYNAEVDELTHKAVLDAQFLNVPQPNANIVAASNVLVNQGTFQFVVNALQTLAVNGSTMTQTQIVSLINATNVDRCLQVLPAIDAYFATEAAFDGTTPLRAIRPSNCPSTSVLGPLESAAILWQADTKIVSSFLQSAPFLTGAQLASQGLTAYNAEVDELTHKAVLDAQFLNVPLPNGTIVAASNVLVNQGTFQFVVNALQTFAVNGTTMTPAQVIALVNATNIDRCLQVLPAIDAYFNVTGSFLGDPYFLTAGRPNNCPGSPAATSLETAVIRWQADTGIVSAFLQTAMYLSGTALTSMALDAFNAEVDELTHKAVIDAQFPSNSTTAPAAILQANQVLVAQGTFQFVVNALQTLAVNGSTMTNAQVVALVQATNLDRCFQVLPAIDQYFATVAAFNGDARVLRAVRPDNCPLNPFAPEPFP